VTSGPTSAATAFSFCVYSSVARSSIPRSNVPRTWSNISAVAASNLGTTTEDIAFSSAAGSALAIAFSSPPVPWPPEAFLISAATTGARDLSSRFRSFSICTGRSLVMAAETATRSCFCRSRSAASRASCCAATNPARSL
jgi:hypothetical protein